MKKRERESFKVVSTISVCSVTSGAILQEIGLHFPNEVMVIAPQCLPPCFQLPYFAEVRGCQVEAPITASVVYFDQLSVAKRTQKLVEITFSMFFVQKS